MTRSESIKEIAAALAKAQGAMTAALKDAENPFFKSRYATLASNIEAIKKPLADNGIAYHQTLLNNDKGECGVETLLFHSSGEWILSDPFFVPVSKADAQGYGSSCTYIRRYQLAAACGIAPEDDDGEAAKGGELSINDFAAILTEIREAESLEQLQQLTKDGMRRAEQARDAKAHARIKDAGIKKSAEFGASAPDRQPVQAKVDKETGEVEANTEPKAAPESLATPAMLKMIRVKAANIGVTEEQLLAIHMLERLEGITVGDGRVIMKSLASGPDYYADAK